MSETTRRGRDELREHLQAMQEVMRQSGGVETGLRWVELKRLWPFLRVHRSRMTVAVAATVGVSLVTLPIPLLIRHVVDAVLPARDVRLLAAVIFGLVALQAARMLVSFVASYSFSVLNQKVLVSIKQSLFRHLLRLPLAFFNRNQSSYLMARLSEVQGMGLLFSSALVMLAIGVLEFVLSMAVMLMLSWRLTLLALLLLPLIFRITQRTSQGLRATSRQVYERSAQVTRQVQEALAGVRTVKTFATEEREARKVEGSLRQFLRSGITQSVVGSLAGELVTVSSAVVGFLVLGVSALEIMAGRFTLGDYLAFSAYMVKLHAPVQMLAAVGLTLQPGMVALRRVLELFDRIAEEDRPGSLRVERLGGEIAFERVEFGYDDQPEVLRGASFHVGAGERIAIIGASGAGKTTIAQLLLGLYRPRRGAIRFDGVDVERLSLDRLRERIGVVSQDVFLFNDTVRNNIRYSREGASDDEVVRAAKLADAHEFIAQLPAGYETVVGEQGVVLSGGQRQRLSIARAILKDPDLILLDEATSQLDPESEERICRALLRSFAGKTLIVIGHRASTARKLGVEQVYELAEGRLGEVSTGVAAAREKAAAGAAVAMAAASSA